MSRLASSDSMRAPRRIAAIDSIGKETWTKVAANDMNFNYGMLFIGTIVHCNI
jgi:hypothetical protein